MALVAGEVSGGEEAASARPRLSFFCGVAALKSDGRGTAQRLLRDVTRCFDVVAVDTGEWRRRDFAAEVSRVDALLADGDVAVGQSYDAWLLMAAAEQRSGRGDAVPYLLLLNPVLGAAQHLNGALLGYRAPRARRVRAAFGLDPDEDGRRSLIRRATYVFGDNDPFSSQSDWRYLRGLGCPVHVVRGWHHLHRAEVEQCLRDILADYAAETAAAIDAERTRAAAADPLDLPGPLCAAAGASRM